MEAREGWHTLRHKIGIPVKGGLPRMNPGRRALDETLPAEVLPTEVLPTEVLPTEVIPTATSMSLDSTIVVAPTLTTSSPSTIPTVTASRTTAITSKPTATADPSENGDEGMSVAAKAGIVIGALGGVLVVFVLVWLVISARRKKMEKRRQQIEDDEKINGPFADSAAIPPPPPSKTPRLSLRPVSKLLPSLNGPSYAERRESRGIALTLNPVSSTSLSPLNRPPGASAWERPTQRSADHNRPDTSGSLYPNNPFHDNQRIPDEPVSPISSVSAYSHRGVGVATTTDSIPEPVSPIGRDDDHHGLGFGSSNGFAGSHLARNTSVRKDIPKPLDLTKPPSPLYAVPPSPSGTEYSMHSISPGQFPVPTPSASAIAAAGGPSHSTVHRVQLDFEPTLEDEMELRAGQLVRLLHEYDDGWALCIRLDRSEQGVVPRTCLSTRPLKPRPAQGGNGRVGPPVIPSFPAAGGGAGGRGGRGPSPSGFRGGGAASPAPGQAY